MPQREPIRPDEQALLLWRLQLREAGRRPWLAGLLMRRARALGNRLRAHYAGLLALPRRARRDLQRRLSLGLAGAALILALSGPGTPANAAPEATITVDGTTCTLDDAITAANTDSAEGGCTAGTSGSDTIDLQTAVTLSEALPPVTSTIILEGNGNSISRDSGAAAFPVLQVSGSGDLTLQRATISGGLGTCGGGIYVNDATLTIEESTISGNLATQRGGGICVAGASGVAMVNKSTIYDNITGGTGGGFMNQNAVATINDSTISGNLAVTGGGINNYGPNLTINSSTITGNTASGSGGGIFNYDVSINASNSVSYSTVILNRSLVSGNIASSGREIENYGVAVFNGDSYNVIGFNGDAGTVGFTLGVKDIVPGSGVGVSNILETTLGSNGGPTQTHALVNGSPAIDVVPDGLSGPFDQRGAPRDVDGNSSGSGQEGDIGAFEYGSEPVAVTLQFLSAEEADGAVLPALGTLGAVLLALWTVLAGWRRRLGAARGSQ